MRVKLKTVSHQFEGELIRDMLKELEIPVYIADHNSSDSMDIYLGYEGKGVELFVEEAHLKEALAFLEASATPEETLTYEPKVRFPYWILIGFAIMLIIFIIYNL